MKYAALKCSYKRINEKLQTNSRNKRRQDSS